MRKILVMILTSLFLVLASCSKMKEKTLEGTTWDCPNASLSFEKDNIANIVYKVPVMINGSLAKTITLNYEDDKLVAYPDGVTPITIGRVEINGNEMDFTDRKGNHATCHKVF